MKLVLTAFVFKSEFDPIQKDFNLEILKTAAKRTLEGLGVEIRSAFKIPGTRLKKLNLTSSRGAGRVIFLLKIDKNKAVLVMVRKKTDKVGRNMTIKNPSFKATLEKNLEHILQDIEDGNYKEFDL